MSDRLRASDSQVADAGGRATFSFGLSPPRTVFTGSVGLASAPATALFTATIGGITWGSWTGNATFGPVQQWPTESFTVTATGLSPGTAYTALFIGMAQDEPVAEILWPSALATAVATTGGLATLNYAIVNNAGGFAVPDITLTYVQWDFIRANPNNWFVAGLPDRITVTQAGIYVVTVESCWEDVALAGNRFHHLERIRASDGVQEVLGSFSRTAALSGATGVCAWTGALSAGDAVRLAVFQDSGAPRTWGGANRSPGSPVTSSRNAEFDVVQVGV